MSLCVNKYHQMNKILKQVLGVDVDQKKLVVTLGRLTEGLSIELYARKVFDNNKKGFLSLLKWAGSSSDKSIPLQIVMEATGVYHEKFAYFLDERECALSVVLPNKISNYMRTLDIKTVTDKSCSQAIARFGLERKLDLWERPNKVYKRLQQLIRERDQIIDERTMVKNQLHAENTEAYPNKNSLMRLKTRIKFLDKQESEIKTELNAHLEQDSVLAQRIKRMTTIPGVGELTALTVLGETNGFELIRNKRQLTSYAGLDVKEKLSGTSVNKKPKISKQGNRNLRKAMYFPAITAIKHNKTQKGLYDRIVDKNGVKMKGLVAVQRKLLELIYTIDKNKTDFDPEYKNSVTAIKEVHAIQTGSKTVLEKQI